jgi:hypothetical protein
MSPIKEITSIELDKLGMFVYRREEVGLRKVSRTDDLSPIIELRTESRTSMVDEEPMVVISEAKYDKKSHQPISERIILFVGPALAKEINKKGIVSFPKSQPKK